MVGNYPDILDMIYSPHQIFQDSVLHRLHHHDQHVIISGESYEYSKMFPDVLFHRVRPEEL
jgi:hypothetical protein